MRALAPGFPRWMHRLITAGVMLLSFVASCLAGAVTLPPSSRADQLCAALGTEAPCLTEEVGHVRGTLTFLVYEVALAETQPGLELWGLLTSKGKQYAARLPTYGAQTEPEVAGLAADPLTRWVGMVADSRTWATFRMLAKVNEGVPVLVAAKPTKGGVDMSTDDGMATTAALRVRVALVRLR